LRGIVEDVKVRIARDINGPVRDDSRRINRSAEVAFADHLHFLGGGEDGEIAIFVADINFAVGNHR
jgi:hypothetical protein